ncbi:MAG: hypothetical protein JW760_02865 [Spirochaetales bacterium]|nr:hypothetical protein [Spirochaetales bacterium]
MASSSRSAFSVKELLRLCSYFDVGESQVRTNLSRMTARGLLVPERTGRTSWYRFSEKALKLRNNVAQGFRDLDWSEWDGKWWGVSFSVPDIKKQDRHYIRKKLSLYRFVSYNPGFWIRPRHKEEHLENHLEKVFSSTYCCALQFEFFSTPDEEEISALWNLPEVNALCRQGLSIIEESRKRFRDFSPEEAFIEKMLRGGEIVEILFRDPLLPDIFLPAGWSGPELKREFSAWNRELTDLSKSIFDMTIEEA